MILKLKMDEIIPLVPNKFINPSPCDIDGNSIGIVINSFNTSRCLILVLFNVNAIVYANDNEIIVEISVTLNELCSELRKDFDCIRLEKSFHSTFKSIVNNG